MAAEPNATGGDDRASIRRALALLVEERRRVVDERDALDAFSDRLVEASTLTGAYDATSARGRWVTARSGLAAVRDAYRATLMSVPHFKEAYDETYAESLRREFGPDLAAALTEAQVFSESTRSRLNDAIDRARSRRESRLGVLDAERESLEAAEVRLLSVMEEMEARESAPDGAGRSAASLAEELDAVAAARTETIRDYGPTNSVDDASVLRLYRDHDLDYPVLTLVARLRGHLD